MTTNNPISLAFLIMLKNEEKHIIPTLESGKEVCQDYFYLDTGSTDNTEKVVTTWCKENRKTLHFFSKPFIDFSTNRNHLLSQFMSSNCSHAILMDANDILIGGKQLIAFLQSFPNFDTYRIEQRWADVDDKLISFYTNRLISRSNKIEYKGKIHEIILPTTNEKITEKKCPNTFYLFQDRSLEEKSAKERYTRDIELFAEELREDPTNTRALYYLANSYFFSEKYNEAISYYLSRIKANKEQRLVEEMFQSFLRIGKCYYYLHNWENAQIFFWKAWDYYHDVEPILIIASHYDNIGDKSTALALGQLALTAEKVDDGAHKDINFYDFFRWQFVAKLCNYSNAKLGYDCSLQALQGSGNIKDKKMINEMMYINLMLRSHLLESYSIYSNKPLIVIYGGKSYRKWNGKNITQVGGLGGAETSAVYLAENLTKKYEVIMCCDTPTIETISNVRYIPLKEYDGIVNAYFIDALIVLRYSEALRYGVNIVQTWLWLQDITPIGNFVFNNNLTKIIVLTEFHKKKLLKLVNKDLQQMIESRIVILGNAIGNASMYEENVSKVPLRFIYSSCPSRGLENVIDVFNIIHHKHPTSSLHIFSDFDNDYVKSRIDTKKLLDLISNSEGVINHGRVSQDQLAHEMLLSEFWVYTPSFNKFEETFCITALECQCAKVKCICDGSGSLREIVGERGIILESIKVEDIVSEVEKEIATPTLDTNKIQQEMIVRSWSNEVGKWDREIQEGISKIPKSVCGYLNFGTTIDLPLIIPIEEDIYWSNFLQYHNWEPEVLKIIAKESTKDTTFLDIGAYVGSISISLAEYVKEVHSYEPNKYIFEYLKKNIETSKKTNIHLNNFALGESESKGTLTSSKLGQIGRRCIKDEKGEIDRKTLDELWGKEEKRDFILKIDVQGEEKNILDGGKEFIRVNRPTIIIEIENDELFGILDQLNYYLFLIDEGKTSRNYICVNKNQVGKFIKKYKEFISVCKEEHCTNFGVLNKIKIK